MHNRPWSATARSRATRHTTRIAIAAAAVACTSVIAPAAALAASSPSSLDSSFGTSGKVATPVGTGNTGEGIKALVADNGGYLAVGSGTDGSGNVELTVARYGATGALDATYGTSGVTSLGSTFFPSGDVFFAEGAAVQSTTGDLLVAGTLESASNLYHPGPFAVVALTSAGAVDTHYGAGGLAQATGTAGTGFAYALAVTSAGETYLGGTDAAEAGFQLVAFLPGGTEDTAFGASGVATTALSGGGHISALSLDGSNIVAAGEGNGEAAIGRYTSSGSADTTFNGGSVELLSLGGSYSVAASALVRADHSIVIGGNGNYVVSSNPTDCLAVAHLSATGALDSSFGQSGIGHVCVGDDSGYALAAASDSSPIYLGGSSFDGSLSHFELARFTSSGVPDTAFAPTGAVTSDPAGSGTSSGAYALLLDGNAPVIGGVANQTSSPNDEYFALERYVGDATTPVTAPPATVAAPPVSTAAPSISGSATVGATLDGSAGSWSGNPTHYVFEWLRCPASSSAGGSSPSGCQTQQNDDITATQDQYSVTADDAGYYMVLEVKGVNAAGDYGVAFSASTVQVPPLEPVSTAAPSISGSATVGATLTGSAGSWSGNPTHYVFEWLRCPASSSAGGSSPSGCQTQQNDDITATQDQYSVTADDAGYYMVLEVKGVNAAGDYGVAFSASTPSVGVPPTNTAPPSLSGPSQPHVGDSFTGTAGSWRGTQPMTYTFTWQRCPAAGTPLSACVTVRKWGYSTSGTPSDTYTVASSDVGQRLLLVVWASNAAGGPVEANAKYFSPVIDSASGTIKATSQTVQSTATQVPATLPTTKLLIGKAPAPTFSAPAAGTVTMLIDQGNLSSLIKQDPGVIAAGGGNVIAAGGGNVIAAGGGNVIAAGGGNVITAGGGNLTRHVRRAGRLLAPGRQVTAARSLGASKPAGHEVTPLKKRKKKAVKPVALFTARHVFKKQGHAKLVLTLTAAGRKRLGAFEKSALTARQHDRRPPAPMKVTLITVFTPAGLHHASVYTTRVIALTP